MTATRGRLVTGLSRRDEGFRKNAFFNNWNFENKNKTARNGYRFLLYCFSFILLGIFNLFTLVFSLAVYTFIQEKAWQKLFEK